MVLFFFGGCFVPWFLLLFLVLEGYVLLSCLVRNSSGIILGVVLGGSKQKTFLILSNGMNYGEDSTSPCNSVSIVLVYGSRLLQMNDSKTFGNQRPKYITSSSDFEMNI